MPRPPVILKHLSIEQEVLKQLAEFRKDLGSLRHRMDRIETSRSSHSTVKQPDTSFVKKDSPWKKGKKVCVLDVAGQVMSKVNVLLDFRSK